MGTLNGKTLSSRGLAGDRLAIALRARRTVRTSSRGQDGGSEPEASRHLFTAARRSNSGGKGPAASGRHPVRGAARGSGGEGGGDIRRHRHSRETTRSAIS